MLSISNIKEWSNIWNRKLFFYYSFIIVAVATSGYNNNLFVYVYMSIGIILSIINLRSNDKMSIQILVTPFIIMGSYAITPWINSLTNGDISIYSDIIITGIAIGMILLMINDKYVKNDLIDKNMEFIFWITISLWMLTITTPTNGWMNNMGNLYTKYFIQIVFIMLLIFILCINMMKILLTKKYNSIIEIILKFFTAIMIVLPFSLYLIGTNIKINQYVNNSEDVLLLFMVIFIYLFYNLVISLNIRLLNSQDKKTT